MDIEETKKNECYFIFVTRGMQLGGIETSISNIANELVQDGHKCAIIAESGPLDKTLHSNIARLGITNANVISKHIEYSYSFFNQILVISHDPFTASQTILAAKLIRSKPFSYNVRFAHGVFHPRSYFHDVEPFYQRAFNKWLMKNISNKGTFFMNKDCQKSHIRFIGDICKNSPVVHLPIPKRDMVYSARCSKVLQVVSIGRIVPFKSYNFAIPQIVGHLLSEGIDVNWQIYGDGPSADYARKNSRESGFEDKVQFNGVLNYEEFKSAIEGADLFVGMGTSLAEASSFGVPALSATDSSGYETNGYFFELPPGNVGEQIEKFTPDKLFNRIKLFYRLSADERQLIGEKCRAAAYSYGSPTYLDQIFALSVSAPDAVLSKLSMLNIRFFMLVTLAAKVKRSIMNATFVRKYLHGAE